MKDTSNNQKAIKETLYQDIYNAALEAANKAAANANPAPMVVSQHASPLDDNSPVVKQWHVSEGVCGFAWVTIKPANTSFAKWLKAKGIGRTSDYGGLMVFPNLRTQSMERKEAWAAAFAKVLHEVMGIRVYVESRMD